MSNTSTQDLISALKAAEWPDVSIGNKALIQAAIERLEALVPQPIETACKDSVVLTELGPVRYVEPSHWASPVPRGWHQCDPDGDIFSDSSDGMSAFTVNPKYWMPCPVFPEA